MDLRPFDALLLVSFGGPEKPDDVVPFLENVTAGRGIPRERLEEVGEHYFLFGGKSPINDLNRELLAALRRDFAENGIDLPIYWGNRNWDPYLREAAEQMAADGVRRAACFVTSAYSSYSGCRQYREDLYAATDGVAIELSRLRHYFNHPGFVGPFTEATKAAVDDAPAGTHVVFVTHSIPTSMNEASGGPGREAYVRQHQSVADLVAAGAGAESHSLAYCSRSGSPRIPWLEPDINDHLAELKASGVESVVVVPIGFVSDHMEVIYDLDTEGKQTADELGLRYVRADTPGAHPDFVAMVRELLVERAAVERGETTDRPSLGELPPSHDLCPIDCCLNPRSSLPVVGSAATPA
ncbi:ferrochelatase [Aeromicrobium fastidiosum]|uniref:Coproporphyrin III ferrochelatase n=1 Tax=Aeromicrobium fastidiosum TaxID=52699 RepID=A0A641AM89_9ACTN|nr:ferrochelatase [Aeromicrobium fastidiosum]KAA1375922.1 ferrochelatase [Aeromicrobium fastidiosum]MBP2392224.1 ferrochelatase [Aeromicrobium fastidiosum]